MSSQRPDTDGIIHGIIHSKVKFSLTLQIIDLDEWATSVTLDAKSSSAVTPLNND